MKKIILLSFTLFVLASCKNEKIQAISVYEQSFENVKMELNFHSKTFEKICDIYVNDSIKYYKDETQISSDSISYWLTKIDTMIVDAISVKSRYNSWDDNYDFWNRMVEQNVLMKEQLLIYKHYTDIPNELLCSKYKCIYDILNPITGIKQEISKFYYISPTNTILKTEI